MLIKINKQQHMIFLIFNHQQKRLQNGVFYVLEIYEYWVQQQKMALFINYYIKLINIRCLNKGKKQNDNKNYHKLAYCL
jgi:hypothetical protein